MPLRFFQRKARATWPPIPPEELIPGVGGGGEESFLATGREFVGHFKTLAGLQPDARVLDAGCGCGRMAIALADYLGPNASYEGFDVVRAYTDWCTANITSVKPQYRFAHVDVWNKAYNPTGVLQADSFAFPYADDDFDFAWLTSVFTHMLPADIDHYLSELHRVIRPGGRVLATYFILTDESRALIDAKASHLAMLPTDDGYWTTNLEIPEAAVAYDAAELTALHDKHGFKEVRTEFGNWCARPKFLSYQDIVLLEKL